jgi:cyclophilin family peptidyl-prolyl cis-trans isomerase
MKRVSYLILLTLLFVSFSPYTYAQQKSKHDQPIILIETNMGNIEIKLYDKTVYHKNNFLKLVKEHYYDSVLFHRVIPNFVIQAGDPESKHAKPGQLLGNGGPGYTIPAEICPEYFHKRGAVAAARTPDQINPTRRSSGSQFYIVVGKKYTNQELNILEQRLHTKFTPQQRKAYTTIGGTPFLDGQYTVFGEVIKGMDVVEKISKVKTDKNDRPVKEVRIITMKIIKK